LERPRSLRRQAR